jgi:hypothetical protein
MARTVRSSVTALLHAVSRLSSRLALVRQGVGERFLGRAASASRALLVPGRSSANCSGATALGFLLAPMRHPGCGARFIRGLFLPLVIISRASLCRKSGPGVPGCRGCAGRPHAQWELRLPRRRLVWSSGAGALGSAIVAGGRRMAPLRHAWADDGRTYTGDLGAV